MLRVISSSSHGQIYGSLDLCIDYVVMKNALLTVLKTDAHYIARSNTSGNPAGVFLAKPEIFLWSLKVFFWCLFFSTLVQ